MAKKVSRRNKTAEEKIKIKNEISKMYFQGISPYKMHDDLKLIGIDLSVKSIYNYINKMKEEWLEMRNKAIESVIIEELAKLDNMEKTIWEAWERSCKQSEKKTNEKKLLPKTSKNKNGETKTTAQIVEQHLVESNELRDGNPKFIELLLSIHDKRMALLGKEKAVQIFVQNNYQDNSTNNVAINPMYQGNYIIELDERREKD